jgi:hypothetical protein
MMPENDRKEEGRKKRRKVKRKERARYHIDIFFSTALFEEDSRLPSFSFASFLPSPPPFLPSVLPSFRPSFTLPGGGRFRYGLRIRPGVCSSYPSFSPSSSLLPCLMPFPSSLPCYPFFPPSLLSFISIHSSFLRYLAPLLLSLPSFLH